MSKKFFVLVSCILLFIVVSSAYAQDSIYVFPSFKEFEMTSSCNVKKYANGLWYHYSISNNQSSMQEIECFFVESLAKITSIINPDSWFSDTSSTIKFTINWCSSDSTQSIYPGYSNRGFSFTTLGLPYICNYFAIGHIEIPSFSEGNEPWIVEGNDLLKDSKIGKTIGAKDPPSPLIPEQFIDTLISFNEQSLALNWIASKTIRDKYNDYLTNAKLALQQDKTVLARCYLQDILRDVDIDSSSTITSEAYALLRYNTEYLIGKLPPVTGMIIRLTDSNGGVLTGGSLQYYEGSWKNAVNNQDGTFIVNTNQSKVSLRMTYAYGSQTLSNVNVGNDIITFKTINAIVQLKDSHGNIIDKGVVQYYSGEWRDFGTTINGRVTKEFLPINLTLRAIVGTAQQDKTQNLLTNPVIEFTF